MAFQFFSFSLINQYVMHGLKLQIQIDNFNGPVTRTEEQTHHHDTSLSKKVYYTRCTHIHCYIFLLYMLWRFGVVVVSWYPYILSAHHHHHKCIIIMLHVQCRKPEKHKCKRNYIDILHQSLFNKHYPFTCCYWMLFIYIYSAAEYINIVTNQLNWYTTLCLYWIAGGGW